MDPITLSKLAYRYGWTPIGVRDKVPQIKNWQNTSHSERTLDRIEGQYREGKINNISLLAGAASGFVVIDIDLRKGGINNWMNFLGGSMKDPNVMSQLKPTFAVSSPSGGFHYYFLYDERMVGLFN